jgi:hypothetical protein
MLNVVDAVREGQGHAGSTPATSTTLKTLARFDIPNRFLTEFACVEPGFAVSDRHEPSLSSRNADP